MVLAVAMVEHFHSAQQRLGPVTSGEERAIVLRAGLALAIRHAIESLPWRIKVHFPLPHFTDLAPFAFEICDIIVLRQGLDGAEKDSSEKKGRNRLLDLAMGKAARDAEGHAWLSIAVAGYADSDPDSVANSQAITLAKQCLYFLGTFATAMPNFHSESTDRSALVDTPSERVELRLPSSLRRYFCDLTPRYSQWETYETGPTLLTGKRRAVRTPEERTAALETKLEMARRFFATRGQQDYDAVGAAIEWYVDSVTAENQTFAYIAACIGLEAVLGYGESTGRMDAMSSRLADRYGFLLGSGRAERESLTQQYKEILVLRGELVHARSKRLTGDQETKLYEVQNMLFRVIGREVATAIGSPL